LAEKLGGNLFAFAVEGNINYDSNAVEYEIPKIVVKYTAKGLKKSFVF